MSMYERLKERQVGLGVCKDEPGRASIATNGQPAAAECLNSDQVRDRARHRPSVYEAEFNRGGDRFGERTFRTNIMVYWTLQR